MRPTHLGKPVDLSLYMGYWERHFKVVVNFISEGTLLTRFTWMTRKRVGLNERLAEQVATVSKRKITVPLFYLHRP